jgi:hypothetical protein
MTQGRSGSPLFFGGDCSGNLPVVRNNFSLVIVAIILLSVVPMVVTLLRDRGQTGVRPGSDPGPSP